MRTATLPMMLGILLFTPTLGTAQQPSPNPAPLNTIAVNADGKFEAQPDTAMLQFNISAQADKAKAAYADASRQAEQIRQVLRSNGVEPKAAELGYYSVQPVYDWKNPKRKLVGYRVTANVSVKLKDFSKVGSVTEQLADSAVSEGQSVTYTLEDVDAAKDKAVEDAYRHARASADAIARASGRVLGELSYASVDTSENIRPMPLPLMMAMARVQPEAAPPTSEFTPQSITITAHVNATFNLK